MLGDVAVGKTALATALLQMPLATDEELARITVVDGTTEGPVSIDATVLVVRGLPTDDGRGRVKALQRDGHPVFVAVHARDVERSAEGDEALREAWSALVPERRVHLTATPPAGEGGPRGLEELRSALLDEALERAHAPVDRALRAKRPYALSIIGGAALVTAAEGLLPGAAALVIVTQAGAISSLHFLYTGRWLGRSQAMALLPTFAAEAAGGSVFLLVKSFFPPTGVADVLAAGVAALLTIAVLGAITSVLDRGYSLSERERLVQAFRRMRARTKAERKAVVENRRRWTERAFWTDLARRIIFDP
jgi:hypothetical protein